MDSPIVLYNNKIVSTPSNVEIRETTQSPSPALSFSYRIFRGMGEIIFNRALRAPASFYTLLTTQFAGNKELFASVPSPLPLQIEEGSEIQEEGSEIQEESSEIQEESSDAVETKAEEMVDTLDAESNDTVETKAEEMVDTLDAESNDTVEVNIKKTGSNITPKKAKGKGKRKKTDSRNKKAFPRQTAQLADDTVYYVFNMEPELKKALDTPPVKRTKEVDFLGSASGLSVPAKLPSLGLKSQPWAKAIENYASEGMGPLPFINVMRGAKTVKVDISAEMVENLTGLRKVSDHHISLNVLTQALDLKAFTAKAKAHKAKETNVEYFCKLEKPGCLKKVLVLVFKAERWHEQNQVKLITAYTTSLERVATDRRVTQVVMQAVADRQWDTIKIEHKEEFLYANMNQEKENLINA